ncbi:MAG TPA: hypothetical protein VLA72_12385, partial [Anaerolineales bacterium]|nr:hypothetical protein [Anaerolineales bacterium]
IPLLQTQNASLPDWRNGLLVEAGYTNRDDARALNFRSIRTTTFLYVEYFADGSIEFYDLVADPYERNNIAGSLDASVLASLHDWLEQLKTCKADMCRTIEMIEGDFRQ